MDRFQTLADARSNLAGTGDWAWGGNASWDGWCEYAYRNATTDVELDDTLRAYLTSVGENPTDYSL